MLTVKTDKKLKEEAQDLARSLGFPLGTLINAQLRQFVRDRQAIFSEPLVPNAKTAKRLRRLIADADAGRNMVGPFDAGKELDDYLLAL